MASATQRSRWRLSRALVMLGLIAGGSLVATAAPAAAVPGLTIVSTPSPAVSSTTQVDAVCPAGTVVYGAAGRVIGGGGDVLITDMRPKADLSAVRVEAVENDPTPVLWHVVAEAFCAPDNGHNLHLVEVANPANGTNLSPRSTWAYCPAGEVMFGAGFRHVNAGGNVFTAEVEPEIDPFTGEPVGVEVESRSDTGFAGAFDDYAAAVCGIANGSVVSVTSGISANGTDPSYQADSSACPQGAVTGGGWKVTDNTDGILVDKLAPNAPATRTTVRAWDNGGLGNPYDVTAFAYCAD
jgi:hypothetical protein